MSCSTAATRRQLRDPLELLVAEIFSFSFFSFFIRQEKSEPATNLWTTGSESARWTRGCVRTPGSPRVVEALRTTADNAVLRNLVDRHGVQRRVAARASHKPAAHLLAESWARLGSEKKTSTLTFASIITRSALSSKETICRSSGKRGEVQPEGRARDRLPDGG